MIKPLTMAQYLTNEEVVDYRELEKEFMKKPRVYVSDKFWESRNFILGRVRFHNDDREVIGNAARLDGKEFVFEVKSWRAMRNQFFLDAHEYFFPKYSLVPVPAQRKLFKDIQTPKTELDKFQLPLAPYEYLSVHRVLFIRDVAAEDLKAIVQPRRRVALDD